MAEIDNKKPDGAPKPKPDDSTAHALTVFAQSLAYTAVEAPARGVAQLLDHAFTTKFEEGVQSKLANAGIQQPEAAAYGTKAWTAEQLGNGIGMVVPMWLARKAMVGKAEQALVKGASVEGGFAAGLKQASLADSAFHEMKLSARTGILYGAAFTPTEDQNSSGNIIVDRIKQGFNSGVTFGAMGYSSSFTSGVLGRAASSLESTTLPSVFKSPLKTALHSSLIHGAISGVPGGALQAQLSAMENGKPLASLQDFKENVISMTMVGGTMGSAGLFKETPVSLSRGSAQEVKTPLDATLHNHPFSEAGPSRKGFFLRPAVTGVFESSAIEVGKPAHPFDIKFEPIVQAWQPEAVDKHMTVETRPIEFTPKNRDSLVGNHDWAEFNEWGIETRDVPVNVYRFPGITTEIVVPSDYAKILDQIRLDRLNPGRSHALDQIAANDTGIRADRILPEEMAQMLSRLVQPDVVKSVQLLDHESPLDLKRTYDRRIAAEKSGDKLADDQIFVAQADAHTESGTIRFYDVSTHDQTEMQETTFHEWSHLLENVPLYNAFEKAAIAEQNGFYTRKYARESDSENWAVHLGERFLSSDGAAFAELPENAPARTLVMAKALRNMLEQRKDNPSSKHAELLARVEAADGIATANVQKGILADIASGDHHALGEKLKFLNIAATTGQSPELLTRIIAPIKADLMRVQEALDVRDREAKKALAETLTIAQAHNYTPQDMPALLDVWKGVPIGRLRLFKLLPEEGQKYVLHDLSSHLTDGNRFMLLAFADSEGPTQQLAKEALNAAQNKFTQEGLDLFRAHQPIPKPYLSWLEKSHLPEARLAAMQNKEVAIAGSAFIDMTNDIQPPQMRELIAGEAMSYVRSHEQASTWTAVLGDMSQSDQVALFRELGHKHDAAYTALSTKIDNMNATEFGAASEQIQRESLEIMKRRENTPEFILANPRRIKDAHSFLSVFYSLDSGQVAVLVKDGVFTGFSQSGVDHMVKTFSNRFNASAQLDIFEAMPPSVESKVRINILSAMTKQNDRVVVERAEQLLADLLRQR